MGLSLHVLAYLLNYAGFVGLQAEGHFSSQPCLPHIDLRLQLVRFWRHTWQEAVQSSHVSYDKIEHYSIPKNTTEHLPVFCGEPAVGSRVLFFRQTC